MARMTEDKDICLTTLAIGSEYRQLAQILAQDALERCPGTPFVILTDKPQVFLKFKNVIPIKHQIQSVGIYHDKRCALQESLKHFDCSIFLDSDCRLFENIVESRPWKQGLTVRTCHNLLKFVTRYQRKNNVDFYRNQKYRIVAHIGNQYNINVEDCKFCGEILFALRKDNLNNYETFLKVWDEIRILFEGNGVFNGEGMTIGLAAHIAKLNIYHYDSGYLDTECDQNIDYLYKDRLFYNRNNVAPEISDKLQEFKRKRKEIEKKYSWSKKIKKPIKNLTRERRLKKLKARYNIVEL
ncbi:MAG: hypothetical protein QNJ64_11895 [Crocosphaera sp.]|nr:hypothetical protein [Crocosphaera sp.]